MTHVNLTLGTDENISIDHGRFETSVELKARIANVLDHFSVAEVVAHFGPGDLLDEIGSSTAIEHFDIESS